MTQTTDLVEAMLRLTRDFSRFRQAVNEPEFDALCDARANVTRSLHELRTSIERVFGSSLEQLLKETEA